ncbi:diaminopimelate epimerase [Weizmannia acidilactici]|uniref:diaminopimelate epimerase n=1 Tax=Weizmannia acidilactici TaxID=2607726 RepID=UPI00124E2918|nr:diaminopimelate epimerase [Weizmannia acidilactici]GER74541.1 diaminopimelate epimerase [Weizmannia acidilactici]
MELKLIKCHGSGNDFLIIDETAVENPLTDTIRKEMALSFCKRSSGLGADGLLFVSQSKVADAKMRIFNADGSEASMCGNGLRCVARYVSEKLGKDDLLIETMKANLYAKKAEPLFGGIPTFRVEISPVLFGLDKLPMRIGKEVLINEQVEALSKDLSFTAVAVPNPHLISFVGNEVFHSDKQKTLSEYVNGPNEIFPDGVNVSFVKPIGKNGLYVRTFERGVGFTNACGTAMSASSLVACLLRMRPFEEMIEVYNNGGKVRCLVHKIETGGDPEFSIDLIGNATYLYGAVVSFDAENPAKFMVRSKKEFTEQAQYEKLEVHAKEVVEKALA